MEISRWHWLSGLCARERAFSFFVSLAIIFVSVLGLPDMCVAASAADELGCYNLDCPTASSAFVYQGGPVVQHAHVYLVRFSTTANGVTPSIGFVPGTFGPKQPNVVGAVNSLLSTNVAGWWMKMYSPSSSAHLYPGSVAGVLTLYDAALATAPVVHDAAIVAELSRLAREHLLPGVKRNDIFVLFFRAGQTIIAPGLGTSTSSFCSYHSADDAVVGSAIDYVVMPNEGDASGCDEGGVSYSGLSAFDALTVNLSHELVETITDPSSHAAWTFANDDEIADACASDANGVFPAYQSTSGYYFALLYARGLDGCFGQTVTTRLTCTSISAQPGELTVTLDMNVYGEPSDQTLDLYVNNVLYALGTTDTDGQAVLSAPAGSSGDTFRVAYSGNGPLSSAQSTCVVAG